MEDKITKKDRIKISYIEKFGTLPAIPMIQCSGKDDPKYINMLMYALKKGRAVTNKDVDKFFPLSEGVDY